MSVLSDHRSSPTLGRRDNQGLSSAGIARPNRVSTMENYAEAASDTSDQTGTGYVDPIGPLPTRPMTSAGKRDDDFGDEELGDDLLPE